MSNVSTSGPKIRMRVFEPDWNTNFMDELPEQQLITDGPAAQVVAIQTEFKAPVPAQTDQALAATHEHLDTVEAAIERMNCAANPPVEEGTLKPRQEIERLKACITQWIKEMKSLDASGRHSRQFRIDKAMQEIRFLRRLISTGPNDHSEI